MCTYHEMHHLLLKTLFSLTLSHINGLPTHDKCTHSSFVVWHQSDADAIQSYVSLDIV